MRNEVVELIERKRRQVLVHSFLYYQLNENIISDFIFDDWCKHLVELTNTFPKEAQAAAFHKEFEGFDGSSGYDLPFHYPEIQNAGHRILAHRDKVKNFKIGGRK
ncbi:DNA ligase LigA-related protein [Priestia megaterium]|uniref:DNA ligase LigA-related protein n=1 Tax=Priestia megaterium TaxID=1404 RepID=UPI000BF64664|nr:hypothetical protein [Priestia megaterium]PFW43756.1 hypothetical protein COL17_26470 [Priestia megaterium]